MATSELRQRIEAALALPDQPGRGDVNYDPDCFDPWEHVIMGIDGSYSSAMDQLFMEVMILASKHDMGDRCSTDPAAELVAYILSGHGMLEYGTSPRVGWPAPEIEDLWVPLIDKWAMYYRITWRTADDPD